MLIKPTLKKESARSKLRMNQKKLSLVDLQEETQIFLLKEEITQEDPKIMVIDTQHLKAENLLVHSPHKVV